jgi:DNA-binding NarL/FixJ family response regulator
MSGKKRLLIADDHEVVRRGIMSILAEKPDYEVVAQASNGREAVDRAVELKPDVAIMDIGMPELNGLEATRQILEKLPKTEVLVLTVHDSEQVVREVLKAGARGYVLKSDAGKALIEAIESLGNRDVFFTSKVSEVVLHGFIRDEPVSLDDPDRARLTPREREIMQLLAEGLSNKEIGARLGIGIKTVETHRTNIMNKLNLHSVSDLVRYAVRNRIIEP